MDGTCNREVFMQIETTLSNSHQHSPVERNKPFLDYCIFGMPLGSGKGLDQEAKIKRTGISSKSEYTYILYIYIVYMDMRCFCITYTVYTYIKMLLHNVIDTHTSSPQQEHSNVMDMISLLVMPDQSEFLVEQQVHHPSYPPGCSIFVQCQPIWQKNMPENQPPFRSFRMTTDPYSTVNIINIQKAPNPKLLQPHESQNSPLSCPVERWSSVALNGWNAVV